MGTKQNILIELEGYMVYMVGAWGIQTDKGCYTLGSLLKKATGEHPNVGPQKGTRVKLIIMEDIVFIKVLNGPTEERVEVSEETHQESL